MAEALRKANKVCYKNLEKKQTDCTKENGKGLCFMNKKSESFGVGDDKMALLMMTMITQQYIVKERLVAASSISVNVSLHNTNTSVTASVLYWVN